MQLVGGLRRQWPGLLPRGALVRDLPLFQLRMRLSFSRPDHLRRVPSRQWARVSR
jgi:hypothetical protein